MVYCFWRDREFTDWVIAGKSFIFKAETKLGSAYFILSSIIPKHFGRTNISSEAANNVILALYFGLEFHVNCYHFSPDSHSPYCS